MALDDLRLHDADKFWHARVEGETLLVRTGKLGSEGRERAVKPSSAEGKRGNLHAELRNRAWKQIRKGYRHDAPSEDQPLRWLVPAPDFMAIGARGLSVSSEGRFAVFEQHSNGKGSRVYRLDLDSGERAKVWEGSSFLLRGVWALDAEAILFTPEKGAGWETREIAIGGGESRALAHGQLSMLGTILGADRSGARVLAPVGEMELAVIERASGRELLRAPIPPTQHSQGRQCALSPDGSMVVMAAPPPDGAPDEARSRILIHAVDTGEQREIETACAMPFDALAWLGDDRLVLLERFEAPQIWQVRPTLAPGPKLALEDAVESEAGFYLRPVALAAAANGRYIAAYDGAGGLAIVDAESLEIVFAAEHRLFGQRGAVALGPDGIVVTTGGGMLGRWDTGLEFF